MTEKKCVKCSCPLLWDSDSLKWNHIENLVTSVGTVCFTVKYDGLEFVEFCGCKNPTPKQEKP